MVAQLPAVLRDLVGAKCQSGSSIAVEGKGGGEEKEETSGDKRRSRVVVEEENSTGEGFNNSEEEVGSYLAAVDLLHSAVSDEGGERRMEIGTVIEEECFRIWLRHCATAAGG